jgi:hypothetical protein
MELPQAQQGELAAVDKARMLRLTVPLELLIQAAVAAVLILGGSQAVKVAAE